MPCPVLAVGHMDNLWPRERDRRTANTFNALAYLHPFLHFAYLHCSGLLEGRDWMDHNDLCIPRTWHKYGINKCVLNQLKLYYFGYAIRVMKL